MFSSRLLSPRTILIVIAILILSAGVYAFAAANVVPETGAGQGAGNITGYTISNVTYTLNPTNPDVLDAVTFDIAATAGAGVPTTVKVKLDASTSTWYTCTDVDLDATWICDTTGTALNVVDMDTLNVVAAE